MRPASSVRGERHAEKERFMNPNEKIAEDELRPEYDASVLKGAIRGKYYDRYRKGTNLALLAPDVRAAFPTDEAVNEALRSLMKPKH
jgi:hypothetical protein